MQSTEITFDVPKDILVSLSQDIQEFTQQVRLSVALDLYKKHKLSYGKAAELADISKDEFLTEIARNDIDFISYDPSELRAELERF